MLTHSLYRRSEGKWCYVLNSVLFLSLGLFLFYFIFLLLLLLLLVLFERTNKNSV